MNKRILNLAIPNIISNITVPLLGMVDTYLVGHLDSELYIGAIALATMIFNFIYWSFAFLRMGTSGFTAQAFGAKNKQEMLNVLLRSLSVAFIAGVLIVALQYVILHTAFYFIDAGEVTKTYASTYFYIYIWSAPAILGMYAMNGWFVGMQDSRTPMYIAIAVNIINISLSFLFVYGFGMQLEGIALGSLCAQYSGLGLSFLIWNIKYKGLKLFFNWRFIRSVSDFVPFFKVNSDIFLRTLALIAVTTFFTSASAKMGDTLLAVNSLLMQLFILFSYMMDGFAYAAEALTGRYIGEKNPPLLKQMIKRLFVWGGVLVAFFTLIYGLFTDDILRILTDKTAIVEAARQFQVWVLLIPLAGFSAFLWDGIYVGMTASKQMRNSMFVATASFFVIYFLLKSSLGNNALWVAFLTYLSMRGIMQTIIFQRIKYKAGL